MQPGGLQFLVDGFQEALYVGVAAALCLVQLLLDVVVGIMLQILQAEVLQFAL